MQINKFDSLHNKLGIGQIRQSKSLINKQEVAFYLIFFILLLIIEIALIFQQSQHYFYIIPKIILNVVIILVIGIKNIQISFCHMNAFLIITKIFTILLIIMIGQDYFLIFIFILEENQIQIVPLQNYIERFLVKISLLVLIIIESNIINIFIGISLLVLEIVKLILMLFKFKQIVNLEKSTSEQFFQSNRDSNYSKENTWVSRMSSIQFSYLIISKATNTIKFKNRNFQRQFNSICKSDEDYDELILNKMNFQIISRHSSEDEYCKDMRLKKKLINNSFKIRKEVTEELVNIFEKKDNTLSDILKNYEDDLIKIPEFSKNQTLEFYSQLKWDENKITTYSGQIIIIDQDDDIILTLNDITKQNKIQEEKIKDQFKSTIIQSFSHELRTPLNSALNFLQFCEHDNNIYEEIKKNFICPAINALRLQSYLINDIIDFSYLCSDNLELDITQITISSIVDEINRLFKSVLSMKNISLYIDLTNNVMVSIKTDFSRLIQILANLIQNSIKFSSQGMIIVKFTSTSQEALKITIRDHGFGIDEFGLHQIQKLLTDIEERKTFSQFETWHGFGLLISQMLIQKLKPIDQKSLQVFSQGLMKGTKVKFFIQNYPEIQDLSSLLLHDTSNQVLCIKNSPQQNSNDLSINGSLILISDLDLGFEKKADIKKKQKQKLKSENNSYLIQCDNSAISNSFIDLNFELKVGEFHNMHPFLFQHNTIYKNLEYSPRQTSAKIYSYEQIKVKEEQENNQWLNYFFSQRSCTCKTILSVDDEIFNQKSIQFLLKQCGFDVVLAFNGLQALEIVKTTKKCSPNCCLFILILMDYQMPLMNGLEVTMALRQLMENNQVPKINIVGLTAFNSRSDIDQCLKSGMNAILTKPLILKELFSILKQI